MIFYVFSKGNYILIYSQVGELFTFIPKSGYLTLDPSPSKEYTYIRKAGGSLTTT